MKYKATTDSDFADCSGQFSVDYGDVWPPTATTESELAEFSRQFPVDDGEARPPGLAEFSRQFCVNDGEVRPPGFTTDSELAESTGWCVLHRGW